MPKPPRVPSYCHHKPSDRAFCKVAGRFIYLGPYGSEASRAAYAQVVERVLSGRTKAAPTDQPAELSVRELADRYIAHAEAYYVKNGKQTNEAAMVATACNRAAEIFGDLPAREFGPLCLETVCDRLVGLGLSRSYTNGSINRIRRMFRWAGSKELVPASVPHGLSLVPGLKKGRTAARETAAVLPVADDLVDKTLAELPEVVADMVRLQRASGMRPGEVISLRPADLDRSGDVWVYRPASHKSEHHDRERVVYLGPKAQAVLLRYLARDSQTFCFRPCDSESKRRAGQHATRTTPLSCGNRPGSNRSSSPLRPPGQQYAKDSYRQAIHRACKRAGVAKWSPNQLRHTAATEARAEFGLDGAQLILGHAHAKTTEIYAEKSEATGREIARRLG